MWHLHGQASRPLLPSVPRYPLASTLIPDSSGRAETSSVCGWDGFWQSNSTTCSPGWVDDKPSSRLHRLATEMKESLCLLPPPRGVSDRITPKAILYRLNWGKAYKSTCLNPQALCPWNRSILVELLCLEISTTFHFSHTELIDMCTLIWYIHIHW